MKNKTSIRQLRRNLLNETKDYFNSDNRSTSGGGCVYFKNENCGCAIGRKIENKELCKELDKLNETGVGVQAIFVQIPSNLRRLGMTFLCSIQGLHDTSENWDYQGLTDDGKVEVARIRKEFKL